MMLNIKQLDMVYHLPMSRETGLDNQEHENPNSKGGACYLGKKKKSTTIEIRIVKLG